MTAERHEQAFHELAAEEGSGVIRTIVDFFRELTRQRHGRLELRIIETSGGPLLVSPHAITLRPGESVEFNVPAGWFASKEDAMSQELSSLVDDYKRAEEQLEKLQKVRNADRGRQSEYCVAVTGNAGRTAEKYSAWMSDVRPLIGWGDGVTESAAVYDYVIGLLDAQIVLARERRERADAALAEYYARVGAPKES